jgi:hypothetical protein
MRTGNVSHSGPHRRIQPLGLLTCDPIFRPIRGRLLLRPDIFPSPGFSWARGLTLGWRSKCWGLLPRASW